MEIVSLTPALYLMLILAPCLKNEPSALQDAPSFMVPSRTVQLVCYESITQFQISGTYQTITRSIVSHLPHFYL